MTGWFQCIRLKKKKWLKNMAHEEKTAFFVSLFDRTWWATFFSSGDVEEETPWCHTAKKSFSFFFLQLNISLSSKLIHKSVVLNGNVSEERLNGHTLKKTLLTRGAAELLSSLGRTLDWEPWHSWGLPNYSHVFQLNNYNHLKESGPPGHHRISRRIFQIRVCARLLTTFIFALFWQRCSK